MVRAEVLSLSRHWGRYCYMTGMQRRLSDLLMLTVVIKNIYHDDVWRPENPDFEYETLIGIHHYRQGLQVHE